MLLYGIGKTTNLSDTLPWGLCFGLDVFCGIALAAGAFTVAAVVAVADRADWRSIGRSSLIVGCVGYAVAILGALADQDSTLQAASLVVHSWTLRAVAAGALWTLFLLTAILLGEFSFRLPGARAHGRWSSALRCAYVLLVISAAALAIVHQYGLNRLIILAGKRFSPLWAHPQLPLLFYLSSICGALAVILFASWRSEQAFGRSLPLPLARAVARTLAASVFVYLLARLSDLLGSNVNRIFEAEMQQALLLVLEIAMFFAGMIVIKDQEYGHKQFMFGPALIIAGVLANRLNTSITAIEDFAGRHYTPTWSEVLIAYSVAAMGIAGFALCVKHLNIFPRSAGAATA
jgi:Ni/Fe-hydrogenase subunit HybB-like protein